MSAFPVSDLKLESPEFFSSIRPQEQHDMNITTASPSSTKTSSTSPQVEGSAALQPIPKKSAIIKTDRPRPHICTTCTRAFARLEHLKRHERSHTNEKPFQCGACGRCFARRDLVLRHQQKLHASLPTTNRARTRKHNFDHDVQAGDIVQDYLNENINIVYKNTNAKLPLPNDYKLDSAGEESINYHSKQEPKRQRKSVSATKASNNLSPQFDSTPYNISTASSLDVSPQVIGSMYPNLHPHSSTSVPIKSEQLSPMTSKTSPHDKPTHFNDDVSQNIFQNTTPLSFTSQPMYPTNSEQIPLMKTEEVNTNNKNRHSSFSAASLSSYTLMKDARDIQKHDLPEAPHQIGFATPQISAQEMADRALMAGFDLDALGIDTNEYGGLHDDNNNGSNDNGSKRSQEGYFNHHPGGTKGSTPFEFSITPGGSLLDVPLLQQYLHVGGAGGGAGFEVSTLKIPSSLDKTDKTDKQDSDDKNDWLQEFISTPFDINFPTASHHIGFTDSPPSRESPFTGTTPDDIPSLFRSRQIDLFKQISMKGDSNKNSTKQANKEGNFFSVELRNQILTTYHLKNNQFPLLEDLNKYMSLYELEFDKYFPFIHFPSLYANHGDNHLPLMLAMAAIGALYSFHATNSTILAKLSRYLIHNFMGLQKSFDHFNDIPLPITQGLVLDIYLGMFNNDLDIQITSKHLHSVICLVKSTQLNVGLEKFILPPPIIDSYTNDDSNQLKNNYEYFVLAQSRIRTVHVLYYLSVLFASLVGNDIELGAADLQSGTPCHLEELWKANTLQDWSSVLKAHRISIDSKFSLIQISNGESMKEITNELENHYSDKTLNFKTLLSALMSISEILYKRRTELQQETNAALRATKWRMNFRPEIESLLKSWEFIYVKNGGILVPREANVHVINQTPVLKLILPLLSFAKLRKCIYFTPILSNIWSKNWVTMNQELKYLDADPEALRDGTAYSLDIINLWIDIISISKDAEKTSIRTPIFFLTCIFAAILVVAEYLYATEVWAKNYLVIHSQSSSTTSSPANAFNSFQSQPPTLNAIDRVLWLKTQNLMKKVETNLNPETTDSSTFHNVNDEVSSLVLEPSIDLKHTAEIIVMSKMSLKSLNIGVRILADAPVWPVALVFAEALKARSKFIIEEQSA